MENDAVEFFFGGGQVVIFDGFCVGEVESGSSVALVLALKLLDAADVTLGLGEGGYFVTVFSDVSGSSVVSSKGEGGVSVE